VLYRFTNISGFKEQKGEKAFSNTEEKEKFNRTYQVCIQKPEV
jgi:hypothetical protein